MKSKFSLPSESVKEKHCKPSMSFILNLHSLCGKVWGRTVRVNGVRTSWCISVQVWSRPLYPTTFAAWIQCCFSNNYKNKTNIKSPLVVRWPVCLQVGQNNWGVGLLVTSNELFCTELCCILSLDIVFHNGVWEVKCLCIVVASPSMFLCWQLCGQEGMH